MYMYIGLTILAISMACFVKYQKTSIMFTNSGMTREKISSLYLVCLIGLCLVFVSAGRVAVGNDYWIYRDNFSLIAQNRHVSYEMGFNMVVWVLTKVFGQDNYIPIFAFFSIATIVFFLKAIWDQSKWFAGSIFLFLTGSYYFLSMNSIRYYLVLAISLYALKYLFKNEYLKFVFIILIAALFHKTVLVIVPVFIVAHFFAKRTIPKWFYVILAGGILSTIIFQEFYEKFIYKIYPFYEGLASNDLGVSYTNLAKCMAVFAIVIICHKDVLSNNIENKFYLYVNIVAVIIFAFGSFIPEVSRIGYYFMATQILFLPNILVEIKTKKIRTLFIVATVMCYSAYFMLFLKQADQDGIRLLPYFNWILGD